MVLGCCQWNYVFCEAEGLLARGNLEAHTTIVIDLLGCRHTERRQGVLATVKYPGVFPTVETLRASTRLGTGPLVPLTTRT